MRLVYLKDDPTYHQNQLNWPKAYVTDCGKYKLIVSHLERDKCSQRFVTIAHNPNNMRYVDMGVCSLLLAEVGLVSVSDITQMMEELCPGQLQPGVRRFMENTLH